MNAALNLLTEALANERGVSQERIRALLGEAFASYARHETGEGTFICRFEQGAWVPYRVWHVKADDAVLTDPTLEWRVMDAHDEGFTKSQPGSIIEVKGPALEMTRQLLSYLKQYLGKKLSKPVST